MYISLHVFFESMLLLKFNLCTNYISIPILMLFKIKLEINRPDTIHINFNFKMGITIRKKIQGKIFKPGFPIIIFSYAQLITTLLALRQPLCSCHLQPICLFLFFLSKSTCICLPSHCEQSLTMYVNTCNLVFF